jgi:hypothetical protein
VADGGAGAGGQPVRSSFCEYENVGRRVTKRGASYNSHV